MSRRKSREQAFALLFEKSFNDLSVMDLAEGAQDARDFIIEPFALELAQGAEEKLVELDALIEANSHKWSHNRISRVALAVLRLAIYEMKFYDATPDSVAINEAVNLANRYSEPTSGRFVNGVLGTILRKKEAAQ